MTVSAGLPQTTSEAATGRARPRLGFLGTGWIGRNRLQAIADSGVADIVALCDASADAMLAAAASAPDAAQVASLDDLLSVPLDGLVIATPSAQHASQCIQALELGLAVFCQKPLARTEGETAAVIAAARQHDCLLGVDLSYRHTTGMRAIRDLVRHGALGRVFAVDATFHNAYGPDKPWFRDPLASGGGCLIDLGTHLIDLARWTLDFPTVTQVHATVFTDGAAHVPHGRVEDAAFLTGLLGDGVLLRVACSWNLHAGRDAVIECAVLGTHGAVRMENVDGSFTDFRTLRWQGTHTDTLVAGPDAWGGRAAVAWAQQLATGARFDPDILHLTETARVMDRAYGRS